MDLRCSCGHKIAEYTDTTISIMDKKCKEVTTLYVVDGKLISFDKLKSDDINKMTELTNNKMLNDFIAPINRVILKREIQGEWVKPEPISIDTDEKQKASSKLMLYGKQVGSIINNIAYVNKQMVKDLVHSTELFEKMMRADNEYGCIPYIKEIEYY